MHLSKKSVLMVLFCIGITFLCKRVEAEDKRDKAEDDETNTDVTPSSTTKLTSLSTTEVILSSTFTSTADSTTDFSSSTTTDSTESTTGPAMTTTTVQPNPMLKIHFISDLKYNILPIDSTMELCQLVSGELAEGCFGGFVRLASYMSERRSEIDIWMNAGNILQGKLLKLLKFDSIVEATNDLKFDAVAADPEMFQYGLQAAEDIYMEGLQDILVAFNYKEDVTTKQIQKCGCNIGVIGFIDKEHTDALGVPELTVLDEIEYIQKQVQSLEDITTVVIGATSKAKAEEIANIEGVNLVIFSGADASDFTSEHYWGEIKKSNNETAYLASLKYDDSKAEFLFRIGEISLELTEDCAVSNIAFEAVEDYSQLNMNDSLLVKTVAILENLQTTVVNTSIALTGEGEVCQLGECFLGNLVADAIMTAVSEDEAKSGTENPVRFAVFPTWTLFTDVSLKGNVLWKKTR